MGDETAIVSATVRFQNFRAMGAYKYVNELWRKKQSDVMGFLLRVRTWQYSNSRESIALRNRPGSKRPDAWDTAPSRDSSFTACASAAVPVRSPSPRAAPTASPPTMASTK